MNKLLVTAAPHIKTRMTTTHIMLDVIIALVPALIAATVAFGWRAPVVVAVCVAACVISEWVYEKAMKKENTVRDLSAVVTGILLAYNLPVTIPIWQAVFGSFVAIILVKQLFGGIGKNFANPAITARIVMFLAFSASMTRFIAPQTAYDAVSTATPLALLSTGRVSQLPAIKDFLIGTRAGTLGETGVIALLLGGIYLLVRKVITWHTPACFVATVFILTAIMGKEPVYQLLSGGLIIGAFFMATDYVTTPQTSLGRVIFGVGAGVLTVLIRLYGSYPEGVSFAILLMNILTPFINRATMHKPFGGVKA